MYTLAVILLVASDGTFTENIKIPCSYNEIMVMVRLPALLKSKFLDETNIHRIVA